jgi:hypothetical protein
MEQPIRRFFNPYIKEIIAKSVNKYMDFISSQSILLLINCFI